MEYSLLITRLATELISDSTTINSTVELRPQKVYL